MAKITDIINTRSQEYILPERIRAARDTTTGATDELYTNNVIEALGGDKNLPNWIEGVRTTTAPTIPVVGEILKVLGITDDEGAKEGKGRTALDKFVEDFPTMQKEWKEIVEGDEKWGERGWKTVKDLWKATVHDKMLEDIKTERAKAVDDAEPSIGPNIPGSTFLTKLLLPRVTEHIANTGDFSAKDLALDVGENLAMSVPGAMWTGAPVRAASIIGKGLAKAGLGNTAASRVLANLPGHVTNLSNKIASSWGSNLPGTIALGIGGTARNFAGNAVVPFAMEGLDDYAYDEGEGMDQRADFSAGDAITGAIVNQVVNRSLARLGQGLIPEAAGSVEVRSPAVLKMREFLKTLGESSHKSGDDFAASVRATASQPTRPAGTYTAGEVDRFRNGAGETIDGALTATPEAKSDARLASTILDAIDRGDIKLQSRQAMTDMNTFGNYADEFAVGRERLTADKAVDAINVEIARASDADRIAGEAIAEKAKQLDNLNAAHDAGTIGEAEFKKASAALEQGADELARKREALYSKIQRLEEDRLNKINRAERNIASQKDNALYGEPFEYFNTNDLDSRLAHFDANGTYVDGLPYTAAEIREELAKHAPEYVNYANWHGKPTVEPSRTSKILGLTENPTAGEVLLNDAKQAVPTWAVNKAGREEMTKNLLRRIDPTDMVKEEQEATHAAPGQRVRSKTAKAILDAGSGELSGKSRKYLAYLAEHPDAVKTGHSDPKERADFNLWLLTEGRDLLEGTPLHRPTWDVK